ncbi:DUF805 domain-containing protein [Undibacterium aquatile]|uniref:DUF805 domain-containing protein n=2 Tax=Undibacterium aquatile TaxID=1537398 RepID=A0ABR6XG26_9BURK|nr:DUF805 domain-containing protein [Undibacterium aquatile]
MVFCRGCGKEIHETAATCPHCGAQQTAPAPAANIAGDEVQAFDWYVAVLRNYAGFSGRARRKEYWFFLLFNILISTGLTLVDGITGSINISSGMGFLGGLYTLGTFIPAIAVTIRRLHDTNRSGWWMLIALIPLIGAIVLLVFLASEGQKTENRYGAPVK